MTYSVSLEPVSDDVFILRLHEGECVLGDAYLWCCTVVRVGETAWMKGAVCCPPIDGCRAIIRALRGRGMKYREYEHILEA